MREQESRKAHCFSKNMRKHWSRPNPHIKTKVLHWRQPIAKTYAEVTKQDKPSYEENTSTTNLAWRNNIWFVKGVEIDGFNIAKTKHLLARSKRWRCMLPTFEEQSRATCMRQVRISLRNCCKKVQTANRPEKWALGCEYICNETVN